jgi:hypothetical protein
METDTTTLAFAANGFAKSNLPQGFQENSLVSQCLSQLKQINGWIINRKLLSPSFLPLWLFHQTCCANC